MAAFSRVRNLADLAAGESVRPGESVIVGFASNMVDLPLDETRRTAVFSFDLSSVPGAPSGKMRVVGFQDVYQSMHDLVPGVIQAARDAGKAVEFSGGTVRVNKRFSQLQLVVEPGFSFSVGLAVVVGLYVCVSCAMVTDVLRCGTVVP